MCDVWLTLCLLARQEINLACNRFQNTTRETHQAEETCIPKEVGYMLTRLETLLLLENQLRWLPQVWVCVCKCWVCVSVCEVACVLKLRKKLC